MLNVPLIQYALISSQKGKLGGKAFVMIPKGLQHSYLSSSILFGVDLHTTKPWYNRPNPRLVDC